MNCGHFQVQMDAVMRRETEFTKNNKRDVGEQLWRNAVYEVVRRNDPFPMLPIDKSARCHPFNEVFLETFAYKEASACVGMGNPKTFLVSML